MGASALVSRTQGTQGNLKDLTTGNLPVAKEGGACHNWHSDLGRQSSYLQSPSSILSSNFAHLQNQVGLNLTRELVWDGGLPDSDPPMRSSASPRAWSSHSLAEELSQLYLLHMKLFPTKRPVCEGLGAI